MSLSLYHQQKNRDPEFQDPDFFYQVTSLSSDQREVTREDLVDLIDGHLEPVVG